VVVNHQQAMASSGRLSSAGHDDDGDGDADDDGYEGHRQ